jgi:hypothetical protein
LLAERAAARGIAPATYLSVLTRAHLRRLTPLPKDELVTLRHLIGELATIGRDLNQIAHAAYSSAKVGDRGPQYFQAMLMIACGLRDHVKALLLANERSWKSGHE